MPEARERIYDLALRALDEPERQVGELRGRLPAVVAAGGIGATLLTRPVFEGRHPAGVVEIAATALGLLGALALVLAGAYLLGRGGSHSASTRAPRSSPLRGSSPLTRASRSKPQTTYTTR